MDVVSFGNEAEERPESLNSLLECLNVDHMLEGDCCDWLDVVFMFRGLHMMLVLFRLDNFLDFDHLDDFFVRLVFVEMDTGNGDGDHNQEKEG